MLKILLLLLACNSKDAITSTNPTSLADGNVKNETKAEGKGSKLQSPDMFAGARSRAQDVVPNALPALEVFSLTRGLWGADLVTTAKGTPFTYDSKTGRIFSTGHANPAILVTESGQDHPTRSLEIEFKNHDVVSLAIDEARRNLFCIVRSSGSLWVYDVDTLALKAQKSYPPPGGSDPYPFREITIDPATGWIWGANFPKRTLVGHSPDLTQTDSIATPPPITLLASGPDAILLSVGHDKPMEAGGRPGGGPPGGRPGGPPGARPGGAQRPTAPGGVPPVGAPGSNPKSARDRGMEGDSHEKAALNLPPNDLLLFTPSTRTTTATIKLADFIPAGSPNQLATGPDKTIYAGVKNEVFAFGADGQLKWKATLKGEIAQMAVVGQTLGAISHAAANDNALVMIDTTSGTTKTTVPALYSSCELVADPSHNQFILSNTDDASVWFVAMDGQITRRASVGMTAETLVFDPKTGTRYILDRLGGSRIMVWPQGASAVQQWSGGKWPTDLIVDNKHRWLLALGHFEGVIYRWELDGGKQLAPIKLNTPGNTKDTLGYIDVLEDSNTAVVSFPESRTITAVNYESGAVLWQQSLEDIGSNSAGPEFSAVAINGKEKKVYVWSLIKQNITILSLKDGKTLKTITLETASGSSADGNMKASMASAYQGGIVYQDEVGQRLFIGRYVIDLKKEEVTGTVSAEKVFFASKDMILGLKKTDGRTDVLVQLDPKTLQEVSSRPLGKVQFVGMQGTYDPERQLLYTIEMDRALVHVYKWPQ
jgi:outer membrane protein assembly factor BamB